MSRKSVLLGLALLALLAGGVAVVLLLLVRHEPEFYDKIALPPGQERQRHSQEFYAKCCNLYNGMTNLRRWEEKFTDAQINSYFDEDFIRSRVNEHMLPEGISHPRVSLKPGKCRLAFRYGTDSWCSTVVSIDFHVWLVSQKQEANVVAVELEGLHAGSLPIATQTFLDKITKAAPQQEIEVTWYRHNGNPVALLRFQANQPRPSVRLEKLELGDGELVIGGRSLDASPLRAMLGVPPTVAFPPTAN